MSQPVVETCEQQVLRRDIPPHKLRRIEPEDPFPTRGETIIKMLPSTVAVFMDGRTYAVFQRDDDLASIGPNGEIQILASLQKGTEGLSLGELRPVAERIDGMVVLPICPWGCLDVMYIYTGKDSVDRLRNLPGQTRTEWLSDHAQILFNMLERTDKPVFWGFSDSLALTSIPYPHLHLSQTESQLTRSDIIRYRQIVDWDGGISEAAGKMTEEKVAKWIYRQWPGAIIEVDKVGYSIHFPGMKPKDLTTPFFDEIISRLSEETSDILKAIHRGFWGTDMEIALQHLIDAGYGQAIFDPAFFNQLFAHPSPGTSAINDLLHALLARLRRPAAPAFMIRFDPDGNADLYGMFSFINQPIGPFEGIGIKLTEGDPSRANHITQEDLLSLFTKTRIAMTMVGSTPLSITM